MIVFDVNIDVFQSLYMVESRLRSDMMVSASLEADIGPEGAPQFMRGKPVMRLGIANINPLSRVGCLACHPFSPLLSNSTRERKNCCSWAQAFRL